MSDSREKMNRPRRLLRAAMPVASLPPGLSSSLALRRLSPLLLLAAALVALAALFVGDGVPPAEAQEQTTSVYFPQYSHVAREIDAHGLPHIGLYTVAVDPPLESESSVHLRIKPNSADSFPQATQGEDYTMGTSSVPGTTTTTVLYLPAGASEVHFDMQFEPDLETEGTESVHLELVAIEDAPYTVVDDFQSRRYMGVEVVIFDTSRQIPADADPERGIDIQPADAEVGATSSVDYNVRLTSMPDSDVTVKAYLEGPNGEALNIGFAGSALQVSPASLTFDSSNWSTAQTFTVSPQDAALELDVPIRHGLTSDDPDYHTYYSFQGSSIERTHIDIAMRAGGL